VTWYRFIPAVIYGITRSIEPVLFHYCRKVHLFVFAFVMTTGVKRVVSFIAFGALLARVERLLCYSVTSA